MHRIYLSFDVSFHLSRENRKLDSHSGSKSTEIYASGAQKQCMKIISIYLSGRAKDVLRYGKKHCSGGVKQDPVEQKKLKIQSPI